MKYMMLVKIDAKSEAARKYAAGSPPNGKLEAAMGELREKMTKAGVLLDTGGLLPIAQGARIRLANAKLAVTDGPFIESKEVIGGYAILRTKSKEEAVQCGKDFLQIHLDILGPSFGCEMEVRQMFDPSECGPEGEKR